MTKAEGTNPQERESQIDTIQRVGINALRNAYTTHERLGASGIEMVHKNQFGDTAMRGDIEAEAAVLDILKVNSVPVRVYSEEHGIVNLGEEFTAVLDGIDGSAWYKKEQGEGRYGTLFGIFSGKDPSYADYLFGGIMEHATGRLIYGVKGKGSFVMDVKSGETKPLHTADTTVLDPTTRIHIDQYWDINNDTFRSKLEGYDVLPYNLCVSSHYADMALGDADMALACTRKGNLEIAAMYGIIHEAGGVTVTLDGEEIGDKRFVTFAQDTHVPVITAATSDLAKNAVDFFNK